MVQELEETYKLSEQQLLAIQQFFLSDFEDSGTKDWMMDDEDEDGSDNEFNEPDTEQEAGVADWADFGSFQEGIENSRAALIRKQSKDLGKITKNTKWLQGALISAVGNLDLLVFAHAQKIVVLQRNPSDNTFQIIGQFNTADPSWTPPGYIRCLCVLPMSCNRKTETSLYDWSSIIVGMSNGYVRFFTEKGLLLRSEPVAVSPIEEIRLGRSLMAGNQELAVLSQTDLTCIEGLSLYIALKTAKSQLARGETDIEKIAADAKLNAHKLKFESGVHAIDFGVSGPQKATWFDLHLAASLSPEGYEAKVRRTSLPYYSTYVFVGRSPYVGFGWYTAESSQNILSDALFNLGNQLTSSVVSNIPSLGVRSFLGIGVSRKDRPANPPIVEMKPNAVIPMRSTLTDGNREGERIYMAPSKYKLAAVTDSLARVALIDIQTRQVIRMWKGYRDARCAWLEAASTLDLGERWDGLGNRPSTVLFLVIFAPRRGLLEAWSMQNGRRVFASAVDRCGRLIGIPRLNDYLLGFDERTTSYLPYAFFISSDGKIYNLHIPFHRALPDESGSSIHDTSIIKEMSNLVKDARIMDLQSWLQFFRALRTVPAMKDGLEILWRNCNHVIDYEELISGLNSIQQHVENHPAVMKSPNGGDLIVYVATILQLLRAYVNLLEIESGHSVINDEDSEDINITKKFFIDKQMFDLCLTRISECNVTKYPLEDEMLTFTDFTTHFDLSQTTLAASTKQNPKNKLLKKTLSLGKFIFCGVIEGRCTIEHFVNHVIPLLALSGEDIADVFCAYWLSPYVDSTAFISRILLLCEKSFKVEADEKSWLNRVERNILDSQNLGSALSLCLVTRAIAFSRKHPSSNSSGNNNPVNDSSCSENRQDDWVKVELALEWWDLLVRHLQCMIVLKTLSDKLRICLRDMINGSPAYYREQIGKWTTEFDLDPERLYDILDDPTMVNSQISWEVTIGELRKLFPISLTPELVACDCAWECISAWRRRKDKNEAVELLEKSVKFVEIVGEVPRIQHGLCFMLWDTFLRQPFRYLYDFLNRKSSQYKKLEDCRLNVKHFPVCCTRILELLRNTVRYAEETSSSSSSSENPSSRSANDFLFEDFIEAIFEFQEHKQTKPKKPLTYLAGHQKAVNFPLVCHHHHLAMVIELQVTLEEWPPGPKHLFDAIGERAFFESFHAHPLIPMESISESIRAKRIEFLKKCVIHNGSPEFTKQHRYHIYDLTYDWSLDVNEIKRKEIITLFQKGLDGEAGQVMSVTENKELLPYELFDVAVARVRKWFDSSEKDLMSRCLRLSLMSDSMVDCIRSSKMEVVTASPNDILYLMREVRRTVGSVQLNDQAVQISRLATQFEKLIETIK